MNRQDKNLVSQMAMKHGIKPKILLKVVKKTMSKTNKIDIKVDEITALILAMDKEKNNE